MATSLFDKTAIPLVTISPTSTSSYHFSRSNTFHDDDASSTADPSTSGDYPLNTEFTPTSLLQIQARGKDVISFPTPPKQLETPIFSPDTGRPIYLSIRPRRRKGNCRLVRAEDDLETAVARTTYKFGLGKNPIVRIGRDDDLYADEFPMVGRRLVTRAMGFETRRWGKFEWRYGKKKERAEFQADNLLILEKVLPGGERQRVAQLVRNSEFRTAGTKWMAAGNGGQLQMDLLGSKGQEVLDEVVVVMTCLVMLKKEMDRLRAIQIAALTGHGACAFAA